MSSALASSHAVPVGLVKQFGETGPQYEVLGEAAPENGRRMVSILLVQSGEVATVSYDAVMQSIEAC